jgi:hypothetical protein
MNNLNYRRLQTKSTVDYCIWPNLSAPRLGVIEILQLNSVVVQNLRGIKVASQQRQKIITKIVDISYLLALIHNPVKQAQQGETWVAMKGFLGKPSGLLEQLVAVLKNM